MKDELKKCVVCGNQYNTWDFKNHRKRKATTPTCGVSCSIRYRKGRTRVVSIADIEEALRGVGKQINAADLANIVEMHYPGMLEIIKQHYGGYRSFVTHVLGEYKPVLAKHNKESVTKTLKCNICGKPYEGHYNSRYCSKECHYQNKVQNYMHRPTGETKTCPTCGENFEVTIMKKKNTTDFCSVSCTVVSTSLLGRRLEIGEIISEVKNNPSQHTLRSLASVLGTSTTTVEQTILAHYPSYIEFVREVRGCYTYSTRNGKGHTANVLFDLLDSLGFSGQRETTFDGLNNPNTNKRMWLDYFESDAGFVMEYNGMQHYQFVEYFHVTKDEFENQKVRDNFKRDFVTSKGLKFIEWHYTLEVTKENLIELLKQNEIKLPTGSV